MTHEELYNEANKWGEKNISLGVSMYNPKIEPYCIEAYLAGAEPREKRIEELIALINAERKRQEKCDDVHLRKITELEKENAELKKKNLDTQDAITMQMYTNKANKEIADRQLTKAKNIIREFVEWATWQGNSKCPSFKSIQDKAEQFLSEVEK